MNSFQDKAILAIDCLETNFLDTDSHFLTTYPSLLEFFSKTKFSAADLYVGCLAAYGWMPTQLKQVDKLKDEKFVSFLNDRSNFGDSGASLLGAMPFLQHVNNSVVGTSKVLHFWSPEIFPILDSRISRYVYDFRSPPNTNLYKKYFYDCHKFLSDNDNRALVEQKILLLSESGLALTKIRLIELAIFSRTKSDKIDAPRHP